MADPNESDWTQRLPRPVKKVQIVTSIASSRESSDPPPEPDADAAPSLPADNRPVPPDGESASAVASVSPDVCEPPRRDGDSFTAVPELDEPTVLLSLRSGDTASHQETEWKVVAESVRGTSHEKTDMVCQDSHALLTLPNNVLLAAISDGAGSAAKAEIGSDIAARTAVELLRRFFTTQTKLLESDGQWEGLMWNVMDAARSVVEAEAARQGASPRDFACTLITLIAMPELVVVGQIGDGAAIICDTEENVVALTIPQSGEYLNETTFLISPGAMEQAQTKVWRGKAAYLAAFSDGLQMLALKMSDGTPHAPFFTPLFRFIKEMDDMAEAKAQLNSFLRSPRITQRADDDLTLLLAHFAR